MKHLEFIQSIISRLSSNSFILKGWTITICAGLIAINEKSNLKISVISILLLLMFWILDGYYLSLERRYRALYNDVRLRAQSNFDLDISSYKGWKYNIVKSIFSLGLILFHGAIVSLFCFYLKLNSGQ